MGLRATFDKLSIHKDLIEFVSKHKNEFIRALAYIGETFINEARSNRTYEDDTGNLRSSIGYAIVENGQVKKFATQRAATEGKIEASEFVESKVSELQQFGIYLIVFAGMEYALYVEAKGYDVVSGSRPSRAEIIQEFKDLIG